MMLPHYSCGTTSSRPRRSPLHWHPTSAGRHTAPAHLPGSAGISIQPSSQPADGALTSIKQKLGVGSSPSGQNPALTAPVALPGLMKNRPSASNASKRCVPPHSRMSTSIWRAAIRRASASPGGTMVWPWVKPMRRLPWVTTLDSGRLGESTSKSPLTSCRSGATWRRNSKVSRSVRLPRQRTWPILPGVKSFRNYGGEVNDSSWELQARRAPCRGGPAGVNGSQ
jgi:hypothetical protein